MRRLSDRTTAFLLVLGTPLFAELVSGSTPPVQWLVPWVPLAFMGLYGVAALVIRELAIRWKGGPWAVLLLGLAFGVVNEGMAAHSLFDPSWPGIAVLGSYGRWEGVNWLWAEWIVPFHAVWSISFPLFLARQLWPDLREDRLLSDRSLAVLVPVPMVAAVGLSFLLHAVPLSIFEWVGLFAATFFFAALARTLGPRWNARPPVGRRPSSPLVAAGAGAGFFLVGDVGTWLTPDLGPVPAVGFAVLALVFLAFAYTAARFDRTPAGERARSAFVLGGVGFVVALSPIYEVFLGRAGLVPIDAAVLVALVVLYRRRSASLPKDSPVGGESLRNGRPR